MHVVVSGSIALCSWLLSSTVLLIMGSPWFWHAFCSGPFVVSTIILLLSLVRP